MNKQKELHSPSLDVAADVRDFYERYPYPRPVESLEKYRKLWQDERRRRADYHLFWPGRPYREDFSILVAGCGTSQAAKYALRWPKAEVIGIDFSVTSLHSTERLQQKYNLTNLRLHQLPIEQAGELGTSFDQIVCTGVLHHLPDPDAGLAALRHLLKPDAALNLMVYAPYGRTGIYMLQEFCRRLGIRATDQGIHDLIEALRSLPGCHPLETLLTEAPDFRQVAALADALLHPQDRAYSVPQLFGFLEKGGLRFGRWVKQAPYSPQCGVMAQIPQTAMMTELPPAEQYAVVELFRGTMLVHSVVAYRDDAPEGSQPISFNGDSWLEYLPLRLPDTICVQEKLPPGAAGVLINGTHTYRDLYLPINALEKRLYDAIDGGSKVSDILGKVLSDAHNEEELDKVRSFFERLWWYDQVVFDTAATFSPKIKDSAEDQC
jgi:SAM-dependent methyltransferase